MSHARQQIRKAVQSLLGLSPVAWGQVYGTRLPPAHAKMPYLMVFADGEATQIVTANTPQIYQRDVNLVVAGRLRLPGTNDLETVEDSMDAVAADIETRLTFAALEAEVAQLQHLALNSTEMVVVLSEDGAPQYAEVTLAFVAQYFTQEGTPETPI